MLSIHVCGRRTPVRSQKYETTAFSSMSAIDAKHGPRGSVSASCFDKAIGSVTKTFISDAITSGDTESLCSCPVSPLHCILFVDASRSFAGSLHPCDSFKVLRLEQFDISLER